MLAGRMHCPPRVPLTTTNSDRVVKLKVSEGLGPALQQLLSSGDRARFRECASAGPSERSYAIRSTTRSGQRAIGIQSAPVKNTTKPASSTGNSGADQ